MAAKKLHAAARQVLLLHPGRMQPVESFNGPSTET
jgi:hypothetical protein